MKYTYQIQFGASDYVNLYPNADISMNGTWEAETMIWREKIGELKINKKLNDTVYDNLETWFEDKNYFETRIKVKILKDSVEDSIHWFGVKWGQLDKELKSYTVQPDVYDLWAQYFASTINIDEYSISSGLEYFYYSVTDFYPNLQSFGNADFATSLKELIDDLLTATTTWPTSDVVSTLLFGDDYEDASNPGTLYGVRKDYVTDSQTYITDIGGLLPLRTSMDGVFEMLTLFNILPFIDSNDKLRLEHIKFYNDKNIDNAVDFSSYLEEYNEKWGYDNTDLVVVERFLLATPDDDTNEDFIGFPVVYSDVRNRPDAQTVEKTYQWKTNIKYWDDNFTATDALSEREMLACTSQNMAYKYFNRTTNPSDVVIISEDLNNLSLAYQAGEVAYSNEFSVTDTDAHTFSYGIASITGNVDVYIRRRAADAVISNVVNLSSVATSTAVLTVTASVADAQLVIEGKVNGALTGYFALAYNANRSFRLVPNFETKALETLTINAPFSHGDIFSNWWQDNRPSREATYNGSDYIFNNTQYNLRRETVKFHFSGVINPLYGFNDGTRIGKIEKWKRSLATDFYEIDVIYQEDE